MAYLGQTVLPFDPLRSAAPTSDADRFSGNGSTTTFTLSRPVTFPTDLEVFVENIQQEPINSYSVVGTSLVFTEAPPSGTNNVYVVYRNYQSGAQITLPDGSVTYNKLANNIRLFTTDNYTSNAGVSTFTMSEQPADANTVLVTIDGIVQRATEHYSVSGRTITFTSTPAANSLISIRHLGFRTTTTVTAISPGANLSNPIVVNGMSITGNTTLSSGSLVLSPGTAGQPALSFAGNTSTGIFFPATSTIAFSEGGVEAMRIDASGNLLLNTTTNNNSAKIKIATAARTGTFFDLNATGGENWIVDSNNTTGSTDVLGIYALGATGLYLRDDGNVGIGTNSPTGKLSVAGNITLEPSGSGPVASTRPQLWRGADGFLGIQSGGDTSGVIAFYTSASGTPTERARFNSTGAFVLAGGTTTADGIGITFPATQSASTNANTLDDYEEGTWTPTDASGAGLTFTDVTATYTKIGRMVFAQFALRYPSTANGSNSLIGGMPFAPASGNSARQGFVSYTDETTLALILPEGGGATTAAPRTNAGAQITNAIMSLNYIWGEFVYFV